MKTSRQEALYVPESPWCLRCGHHYDAHQGENGCDVEVSDYGTLDCSCEAFVEGQSRV